MSESMKQYEASQNTLAAQEIYADIDALKSQEQSHAVLETKGLLAGLEASLLPSEELWVGEPGVNEYGEYDQEALGREFA